MVTTLLSREDGYLIKQATMPDGRLVELRVPILPAPTLETAQKGLAEQVEENKLGVMRITAMGGGIPTFVYSARELEAFIEIPQSADIHNDKHAQVGYVDYDLLARWSEEVLGDQDLADAVREIAAQQSVYGKALPFVKELLQERLAAYRECVGVEVYKSAQPIPVNW
jgi:hypothetical protein